MKFVILGPVESEANEGVGDPCRNGGEGGTVQTLRASTRTFPFFTETLNLLVPTQFRKTGG